MNISILEKSQNDSCDGFLPYFAFPEYFTSATLQQFCDSGLHITETLHWLKYYFSNKQANRKDFIAA